MGPHDSVAQIFIPPPLELLTTCVHKNISSIRQSGILSPTNIVAVHPIFCSHNSTVELPPSSSVVVQSVKPLLCLSEQTCTGRYLSDVIHGSSGGRSTFFARINRGRHLPFLDWRTLKLWKPTNWEGMCDVAPPLFTVYQIPPYGVGSSLQYTNKTGQEPCMQRPLALYGCSMSIPT